VDRSNFGPIQEGDCAIFSAVSDTRGSTYLIFTAFLTAECSTVELPGNRACRLSIYNTLRCPATLLLVRGMLPFPRKVCPSEPSQLYRFRSTLRRPSERTGSRSAVPPTASPSAEASAGREDSGSGFFQGCLAKNRGSTPEERRFWRDSVYDQIREVMPWQAGSSIERMCELARVSRATFLRRVSRDDRDRQHRFFRHEDRRRRNPPGVLQTVQVLKQFLP